MGRYIIYDVSQDELNILERERFEFISELPYLGSKSYNLIFECDKQYLDMALNAIRR